MRKFISGESGIINKKIFTRIDVPSFHRVAMVPVLNMGMDVTVLTVGGTGTGDMNMSR